MRIADTIESLKCAGPLNIVWGAGCSYASAHAASWLLFDLRVNCHLQVAGPSDLHHALMTLDRTTRREKSTSYGINWAHLCLAELLRTGHVARVLTANFDDGIVKATTALRLLPDLYENHFPELAESSVPSIYSLGEADPAAVAGLIQRGAQTGPWVVIGCSGEHFGLRDALLSVPCFQLGLYWVGYFDQPPPAALDRDLFIAARNAHFIKGFDGDSFMASLLSGVGEFPPAFVREADHRSHASAAAADTQKPMDHLRRWCNRISERVYKIRDSFPATARDLLQRAESARGASYGALVDQAIRDYELYFRWAPASGYAAASFLGLLAEKRSPREAAWLRHKGLQWIDRFPAGGGMEPLESHQVAEAHRHLARFRTGKEADALFAKAEQSLPASTPGRMGGFLMDQHADLLCQWADQERNAGSDAIFERAREMFAEANKLHPDQRERRLKYAQALRHRAGATSGPRAFELLTAARACAAELLDENPKDAAIWQFLGLVALMDAQKSAEPQPGRLAEAEGFFGEARRLRPEAAGDILQNWAAALGVLAASRSGEEALALYARANEIFQESEQIKPGSRALRKNWSSTLLSEARERRGSPDSWVRARQQAEKAEAIEHGAGAYVLACIAAELGNQRDVARYLSRAADHGQIVPLSHVLRDPAFQKFHSAMWFRQLLDRIFDCGLTFDN